MKPRTLASTPRWLDPLNVARRRRAHPRTAHAGRCNFDLLMLRGAVSNLRRLAGKYALPRGFVDALGRTESVIETRIKELRTRGPVEEVHTLS